MKRILVVNVNWLGDVVFSSPVFYALRKSYPESHITCMADPRVYDVLKHIKPIDKIIMYDEKGKHASFFSKISLIHTLRQQKCDIAFLLHSSVTKAWMTWMAGIPIRVGVKRKSHQVFLTHNISPSLKDENIHRSDMYFRVIEGFGIKVTDRTNCLDLTDEERCIIKPILDKHSIREDDYIITLNMGANWDLKKWPRVYFDNLFNQIQDKRWKIVVTGGKQDVSLESNVLGLKDRGCIDLIGQTSIAELLVLLERSNIFICADSGPLHIANSLGSYVIGIYGPTRPEITGPRGRGKSVVLQRDVGCNRKACYHLECSDNMCMRGVMVADVLKSVEKLYKEDRG